VSDTIKQAAYEHLAEYTGRKVSFRTGIFSCMYVSNSGKQLTEAVKSSKKIMRYLFNIWSLPTTHLKVSDEPPVFDLNQQEEDNDGSPELGLTATSQFLQTQMM